MPARRLINRWWTHTLTACFFLLSVVPSAVFAANGVIATNNCHILSGLYGVSTYPGIPGDESVKKYGVTRDVYSYYARFKDSAAATLKADVEAGIRATGAGAYNHCIPVTVTPNEIPYINAGPAYDLLSDNTTVLASPISSPRWVAKSSSDNPHFSCDMFRDRNFDIKIVEIISVSSIYAPLQKVNQPFHQFSDESVDLINATCLSGGKCSIRLSGPGGTNGALADVEPGKVVSGMRAEVTCDGVPSDKAVKLEVTVEAYSGGHQHNDNRPKGLLSNGVSAGIVVEGNTGSGGMPFTFLARPPAGDHKIIAKCLGQDCTQEGPDKVWVGIKGMVPLTSSGSYVLVGFTPSHPANSHNLKPTVSGLVGALANVYRSRFPQDPVLHLNDASLERGGLFDSSAHEGKPWQPPHSTHRKGTDIDIRWNPTKHPTTSIPDRNVDKFKKQVSDVGGKAVPAYVGTDNQHFHVEFGG